MARFEISSLDPDVIELIAEAECGSYVAQSQPAIFRGLMFATRAMIEHSIESGEIDEKDYEELAETAALRRSDH